MRLEAADPAEIRIVQLVSAASPASRACGCFRQTTAPAPVLRRSKQIATTPLKGLATRKFPKCQPPSSLVYWFEPSARSMKTPKPKQWAKEETQRLGRLARQGVGAGRIAAELGRYAGSVRRMARKLGLLLKK